MCLLSYFPPNAEINIKHLRTGASNNADGHGFAVILPNGRIETFRSMDAEEAIARFAEVRSFVPDTDALFHSRWTTHGLTTVENVHPFPVGRDGRKGNIVVAHNGVLPWTVQPEKGDPRSDTRIFAEDMFLHRFKDLDSPRTIRRLEKWLGTGNKLVFLTTNPYYRRRAYILNERVGDWVDGVWHSNDGYLPRVSYASLWPSDTRTAVAGDGRRWPRNKFDCLVCQAYCTVTFGMCMTCLTCNYCYMEEEECLCYATSNDAAKSALRNSHAAAVKEINAQPIGGEIVESSEVKLCDWCGEDEYADCVCAGASARADVAARADDVGMSEEEM